MKKDDFYIGWQDEAPGGFRKKGLYFFLGTLILAIVFAAVYVPSQQKFEDSIFEYGTLTELEGQLVNYPVIGLKTEVDGLSVTVPLIGFGKKGADAVIEHLTSQLEGNPANYRVKLRGTLIKFNGKVWMELTEENESIIAFDKSSVAVNIPPIKLGNQQIVGEIVDPKCFFGVMKPGYGKIHRSCAIRCISGGIPPVLAIKKNGAYVDYYFLTDQDGQQVNQNILEFVGKKVTVAGEVEQVADWKNIKLDQTHIAQLISMSLDAGITSCNQ